VAKHVCKVPEPPADTTRWLGTYGDMVTLLMAFFVMLFAVSDTNAKKFEAFVSGLAGPFNNQSLSLGLIAGTNEIDGAENPLQLISPRTGFDEQNAPGIVSISAGAGGEEVDAAEAREAAAAEAQLSEVESAVEQALAAAAVPIGADLRDDARGLVVAISTDEVLFQTGSAELSADGVALITALAPVLRDAPNSVVVEGHTDDQPLARGGYTNWNLSTDRAVAVVQLLGDALGVPYDRMSAGGYGEHRPLVDNDGPEGRAKNRRVEILIVSLAVAPTEGVGPDGRPAAGPAPAGPPVLDFSEPLPTAAAPAAGSTTSTPIPPAGEQTAAGTPLASILGG
jgi:chemotaxis protein MotB